MKIIRTWHSKEKKYLVNLLNQGAYDNTGALKKTAKIIDDVRKNGDKSVFKYCRIFDKVRINNKNIKVTDLEIKRAKGLVSKEVLKALNLAKNNILKFHKLQLRKEYTIRNKETYLKMGYVPIDSVGVYIPGGKAAYPSSLLMNVIPAKIAKVKRIIICTPTAEDGKVNPVVLTAAGITGVNEIYKIGGVQAIAAMAYGTESIKAVDKIVGPGNVYVSMAKKMVFGKVGIESLAGPSEILIIADNSARYDFIAADLLAQAEHDENAKCFLITNSLTLTFKVLKSLNEQKKLIFRKKIVEKSLLKGCIIVVKDLSESVNLCNKIAPEHLQIMVKKPGNLIKQIRNAGAVFIGNYTPVALGDYIAGTNHVLPTGRTARFSSSLGVDDFIKRVSYVSYSKNAIKKVSLKLVNLAEFEGLDAHGRSVAIRFKCEV